MILGLFWAFFAGCTESQEGFVRELLTGLEKLVPAEAVCYCEINPARATSSNWFWPCGFNTPKTDRAWELHMHEHPVLAHTLRTRNGRARTISDFCSQRQFHGTGLYSEIYRKLGSEDNLVCFLPALRSMALGIGIHRGRSGFGGRERLILNFARLHLTQAWLNVRKLARLEAEVRLLRQAVKGQGRVVVLLSRRGRVTGMTAQARKILEDFFGRTPADHCLPECLERWVRRQRGCLDSEEVPPRLPLVIEREARSLEARLISDDGEDLLLLERRETVPLGEGLRTLGLTPKEAEVLSWVVEGKTNLEIATILAISHRTVQKHLERIFQKLGVETRTAAAVMACRSMTTPSQLRA